MRQKYMISKSEDDNGLTIREFSELDKDIFSLLCEETYSGELVASAIDQGKEDLVAALRTKNMYPPGYCADKIADLVMDLYRSDSNEPVELLFDDMEMFAAEADAAAAVEDEESENGDLDELLDDDLDDEFDDDDLSDITSISVADDDSLDVEEDE